VLHFLKDRFGASATTYASHSDGATASADLWTPGAAFSKNNAGVASMNSMADYIAGNLRSLGIRYVIWKQRINSGTGWRSMADRGSITQNHFDHVHITFSNPSASAVAQSTEDFSVAGDSTDMPDPTEPALQPWAIGVIVALVVVAVIVVVGTTLLVVRARQAAASEKP